MRERGNYWCVLLVHLTLIENGQGVSKKTNYKREPRRVCVGGAKPSYVGHVLSFFH